MLNIFFISHLTFYGKFSAGRKMHDIIHVWYFISNQIGQAITIAIPTASHAFIVIACADRRKFK